MLDTAKKIIGTPWNYEHPNTYIITEMGSLNKMTFFSWFVWEEKEIERDTYKAPAPIGAIALKNDIAVVDIPFAVPLCFWHWNEIYKIYYIVWFM